MLGFSLGKLLVLLAVIGAVWYGFKYLSRMQYLRERRAEAREQIDSGGAPPPPPGRGRRKQAAERPAAEDMTQCPACQAYVPAKGARNCGRPDCPY